MQNDFISFYIILFNTISNQLIFILLVIFLNTFNLGTFANFLDTFLLFVICFKILI